MCKWRWAATLFQIAKTNCQWLPSILLSLHCIIFFFFWLAKCFQRTRSKKLLKCMSKAHWSILKCITYNWYCLCIVKAAFTFVSSKLDLFRSLVPNFTCKWVPWPSSWRHELCSVHLGGLLPSSVNGP